jgi:hypothetical protein
VLHHGGLLRPVIPNFLLSTMPPKLEQEQSTVPAARATKTLLTPASKLSSSEVLLHRVHALLGAYVLSHLLYRHFIFYSHDLLYAGKGRDSDMGFNHQHQSVLSYGVLILPHLLLQLSGLLFVIPRKRTPEGNRIWPEYRWHALAFCMRCLSLMTLAWWRKHLESHHRMSKVDLLLNLMVVSGTNLSADLATRYYQSIGEGSKTTIRGLDGPPGVLYCMSAAQFHGAIHCLLTKNRLSVQVAGLMIIQFSAFGMTMRRKGLINLTWGLILYGSALATGMSVILHDLYLSGLFFQAISFGNIAAMLRMDMGWSKYLLWPIVSMALWVFVLSDDNHQIYWMAGSFVTTALLVFMAIHRQIQSNKKEA